MAYSIEMLVAKRFKVLRKLGIGSISEAFEVFDLSLNKHVALKLLLCEELGLRPERSPTIDIHEVIERAFSLCKSIDHPNVLKVFEILKDSGTLGYTMELAAGGSLCDKMCLGSLLPVPEIVSILSQLSLGIHAIHEAGYSHRNIKPENILFLDDGTLKISNFLNAGRKHAAGLEPKYAFVGFMDYLAPEFMLNGQCDWRTDIYAFGAIAYELLTGRSPFIGDSVYATMTMRLKTDPKPPSSIRKECSDALDTVVQRAMHRDPLQRYQSASDIARDLGAISSIT